MTRSGRKRIIVMWLALHIRLTSRPNIHDTMLPKIFWSSQKNVKKNDPFLQKKDYCNVTSLVYLSNFQDQTPKQIAMWPKVFGKSQKTFLNITHSSTLVRESLGHIATGILIEKKHVWTKFIKKIPVQNHTPDAAIALRIKSTWIIINS